MPLRCPRRDLPGLRASGLRACWAGRRVVGVERPHVASAPQDGPQGLGPGPGGSRAHRQHRPVWVSPSTRREPSSSSGDLGEPPGPCTLYRRACPTLPWTPGQGVLRAGAPCTTRPGLACKLRRCPCSLELQRSRSRHRGSTVPRWRPGRSAERRDEGGTRWEGVSGGQMGDQLEREREGGRERTQVAARPGVRMKWGRGGRRLGAGAGRGGSLAPRPLLISCNGPGSRHSGSGLCRALESACPPHE